MYILQNQMKRMVLKMKNKGFVGLCALLVLGFGLAGCDTGTNSDTNGTGPKDVVLQFGRALQKKNYSTAKSYCTVESALFIDLALAFDDDLSKDGDDIVNGTLVEEITGDTAIVYNKNEGPEEGFHLVKQNGLWKIDLSSSMN
jgi:hypothetical protein